MSESTDISSPEIEDQYFGSLDDPPTFTDHHEVTEVMDEGLRSSLWLSCCTEGNMSPLIKQNLKMKIQNRRLSEGKQELRVKFSPPPVYKLTPEEKYKEEIRKQRNRRSANISRIKRKQQEKNLMESVKELEEEQATLKETVEKFRKQERALRAVLVNHTLKCPIFKEKVRILKHKLASRMNQNISNQPIEGGAT